MNRQEQIATKIELTIREIRKCCFKKHKQLIRDGKYSLKEYEKAQRAILLKICKLKDCDHKLIKRIIFCER